MSHGISNTISVDEDVLWELSLVEVPVALEGTLVVLLQDVARDNFSSFDWLSACLGEVLAHIGIICGDVSNDTLSSFMADVNTNEHCFPRDFGTEVHSPEVTTKLSIDLSQDVGVDTLIVLFNGSTVNEL